VGSLGRLSSGGSRGHLGRSRLFLSKKKKKKKKNHDWHPPILLSNLFQPTAPAWHAAMLLTNLVPPESESQPAKGGPNAAVRNKGGLNPNLIKLKQQKNVIFPSFFKIHHGLCVCVCFTCIQHPPHHLCHHLLLLPLTNHK
jgi:hypothetical protein